jgi:hypothetical protein
VSKKARIFAVILIVPVVGWAILPSPAFLPVIPFGGGIPVADVATETNTAGIGISSGATAISTAATAASTAASVPIQSGTLAKTVSILDLATTMAKPISGAGGMWPSTHAPWTGIIVPDSQGINAPWSASNNNGMPLPSGPGVLGGGILGPTNIGMIPGIPYQFQGAIQQAIASIERHDGLVQGAISVVGRYMTASPGYTARLVQLAAAITSDIPALQSYAALQQQGNAAIMLQTQSQESIAEIEQRLLVNQEATMIMQRQSAANEINAALYTYSTATANLTMTNDSSDALHALRIP